MALINKITPPTILDKIKRSNTMCLSAMKTSAREVFDLMWNSDGKTPQEVCDLLGNEAVKGFDAHAALQGLIFSIDPTWVPLVPQYEYTKNEDGTVTIGNLIEQTQEQ